MRRGDTCCFLDNCKFSRFKGLKCGIGIIGAGTQTAYLFKLSLVPFCLFCVFFALIPLLRDKLKEQTYFSADTY